MPNDSLPADVAQIHWPRNSPHDIVALGDDLSVPVLVSAYRNGVFPWPLSDTDPICWFSPRRRAILELDRLHVGRTLRKALRKGWTVTVDRCFRAVVEACAEPRGVEGTWITPEMIEAYSTLHERGYAHSVEVWSEDQLVGGLYGVDAGGSFSGESMFTRESNASKVALVRLMEHLASRGRDWIDIQMLTPHLQRLGARTISRRMFLERLDAALAENRNLFLNGRVLDVQSGESSRE